MSRTDITAKQRKLASQCKDCPLCQRARVKQRGLAYWFVRRIEGGLCPACKAYEKVYGRKAHEPLLPDNEVGTEDPGEPPSGMEPVDTGPEA